MSPEAIAVVLGVTVFATTAAVSAALEIALVTLSRARVEALVDDNRPRADVLLHVLEHRDQAIAAVLFSNVFSRVAVVSLVAYYSFDSWGAGGFWIAMGSVLILAYLLSSVFPKLLSLRNPAAFPLLFARPLLLVVRAGLFRWMAQISRHRTRNGTEPQDNLVSEEELLALAEQAEADDSIKSEERALIQATLRFGDVRARDLMVPRTDMVTIQKDQTIQDAMEEVLGTTYTRFPVVGEDTDHVIGMLHARDLMQAIRQGHDSNNVETIMRTALFMPDTKLAADLLGEMRNQRQHMSVIIDEYGGTAGLLTLEDLIEELVGEITDEFDVEDPLIEHFPNGDIRVNGKVPQEDLEEELNLELPRGDWNTVGGLIFTHVGRLPTEGEALTLGECRFLVEKLVGQRIARVRITPPRAT